MNRFQRTVPFLCSLFLIGPLLSTATADESRSVRITTYFAPQISRTQTIPDGQELVVEEAASGVSNVLVRPNALLSGVGYFLENEITTLTAYGDAIPDLPYALSSEPEGQSVRVVATAPTVTMTIRRDASRASLDKLVLADGTELTFTDPVTPDLTYEWQAGNGQRGAGVLVINAEQTNELTSLTQQTIAGTFLPAMVYEWRENNRAVFGEPDTTNIVAFAPNRSNPLFEQTPDLPAGQVSFFRATGDAIPALPYRLSSAPEGKVFAESALARVELTPCAQAIFCYQWQQETASGSGELHRVDDAQGSVRIRAGEPTLLTAKFGVAIGDDIRVEWTADNGTFLGEGVRVAYIPHVDFTGVALVQCKLMRGDELVAERGFELPVSPARKRLVLTSVKREGKRLVVHGRSENLANPTDFKVAAYFHSDIYYPTPDNHIVPLEADGRFVFSSTPRDDTNRLVLHLVRNDVDPDDETHCQNPWLSPPIPGVCTGTFDFFYNAKARVPLKINDTDSLGFATYHIAETPTHVDPQVRFLQSRLSETPVMFPGTPSNNPHISPDPNAPPSARLLRSYAHHSQSYLYDIAVAILAFTHAGLETEAKSLLDSLKYLQIASTEEGGGSDGSWYFSYDLDGRTIYPAAASWHTDGTWDRYDYSDRRVSGAIVWATMAIAAYRLKYPEDRSYDATLDRAIAYMERNLIDVSYAGIDSRPLRFQDRDLPATVWDESRTVSVEHNLDAYAAFRMYARITGLEQYNIAARSIRSFVESMWDEENGKFFVGYGNGGEGPNTEEVFMDPQSWGLLSMGHDVEFANKYGRGLQWVYDHFFEPMGVLSRTTAQGTEIVAAPGFFDFFPQGNDLLGTSHQFVWTEGTLGVIMAMRQQERITMSPQSFSRFGASYDADKLLALVNRLQDESGGIPYATWNPVRQDFSHDTSIAGAAWLYFANKGFNPFDPDFTANGSSSTYTGLAPYDYEAPRTANDASRNVRRFVGETTRLVDNLDEGLVRTTPDRRTTSLSRELDVKTVFHGNFAHRPSFVDMFKVFTRDTEDTVTGKALRLEYDITGAGWAGYYSLLGGIDVSNANALTFLIKGVQGGESFSIGFTDQTRADFQVAGEYVGSVTEFVDQGVSTAWKRVVIPLDILKDHIDLTQMGALLFRFEGGTQGSVFIDDIAFENGEWILANSETPPEKDYSVDRLVDPNERFAVEDRVQPGEFGGSAYRLSEDAEPSSIDISTTDGPEYHIAYKKADDDNSIAHFYLGIPTDLREFNALEFFIRGDRDGLAFDIGLLDVIADNRQDGVFAGPIYRYLPGGVTTEWQRVLIPIRDFRGLDLARMVSMAFDFTTAGEGVLSLRGVRFFRDETLIDDEDTATLLVDDFNFSDKNVLGQLTGVYNGSPSLCRKSRVLMETIDSGFGLDRALRIEYMRNETGWCGYFTRLNPIGGSALRLARYNALAFDVQGEIGGERFQIAIADADHQQQNTSIVIGDVTEFLPEGVGVTNETQRVVIPLKSFIDMGALDMTRMGTVSFDFSTPGSGVVYIDNLEFVHIPDIVVDDFALDNVNALGHIAGVFQNAPSSVSAIPVVEEDGGRVLQLEFDRQTDGWCGYFSRLNPIDEGYLDVTGSTALSFRVRGEVGGERFHVNLADRVFQVAEASMSLGDIELFLPSGVTTEWQTVVIPLSAFGEALDLSQLGTFVIEFIDAMAGRIYIDDIVFITERE